MNRRKKENYSQQLKPRIITSKSWAILLNKYVISELSRHESVPAAMFRILTDHDCLAAYLYRISIYASPKYLLRN